VRDDGVRLAAACPEGHWFLRKECPCTVPTGLRNELVESHFPTLKRGANELCASGAVVGTFLTQSSIKPASPLRFAVAPFDKFRAGSLPHGRGPVREDPGVSPHGRRPVRGTLVFHPTDVGLSARTPVYRRFAGGFVVTMAFVRVVRSLRG
jgi:hypothetical protein